MIDLNVNFAGSLSKEDIVYLAQKENVELKKDFEKSLCIGEKKNIDAFNKCLELPLSLLQRKEAIAYAAERLVKRLSLLGYIYAEIRFAPYLFTKGDLNQEMALRFFLKGLYRGLDDCPYIDCNVIIALNANITPNQNKEALRLALDYRTDNKVVGIAIEGCDKKCLSPYMEKLMLEARDYNLPIVVDVNPHMDNNYLLSLIDNGAKRIADAYHYNLDLLTNMTLLSKQVKFEFACQNYVDKGLVKSVNDVPLRSFMSMGLPCFMTASYMTISNTDMDKQNKYLIDNYSFTIEEIRCMLYNASYSAFVDINSKIRISNEMNACIKNYIEKIKA